MKFTIITLLASIHIGTTLGAPIASQSIAGRSIHNDLEPLKNRASSKTPSAAAVQTAADNFASDVSTVSNSLNTLGSTTNQATRTKLANAGFKAESDEDNQRSVLFAAGQNTAANQKIVDNTPIVLNGLSSIAKDPSDANTAKQLQAMESARNANILPSITSLTNSAFKATGVSSTAQKFPATTGSKAIKSTIAATGSTSSTKSSTSSSANAKASTAKASNANSSSAKASTANSSSAKASKGN